MGENAKGKGEELKKVMQDAYGFKEDVNIIEHILDAVADLGLMGEVANALTVLLVCLSAKSENPINFRLSGESSVGKTTIVLIVLKLFDPSDVIVRGRLSRMSLIHDPDLAVPIEEGNTTTFTLNLSGKILVLLEEDESQEFLDLIRPLLSHDKKETVFANTEKRGGKFITKKVIVKGWPAYIGLRASELKKEELKTRTLEASPYESSDKHLAINLKHGMERQYPWETHGRNIETEKKVAHIRTVLKNLDFLPVINPFAQYISLRFPHDAPRSMRDLDKLLTMVDMVANLHQHNRLRVVADGREYLIATVDDYRVAIGIAKNYLEQTYRDISKEAKRFFHEILKPMEKEGEITHNAMQETIRRRWQRTIARSTMIDRYVSPLREKGWIYVTNPGKKPLIYDLTANINGLTEIDGLHLGDVLEDEIWRSGYADFKGELGKLRDINGLTGEIRKWEEKVDRSIKSPLIRQSLILRLLDGGAIYSDFITENIDETTLVEIRQSVNPVGNRGKSPTIEDYLQVMLERKEYYEWSVGEIASGMGKDPGTVKSDLEKITSGLDGRIRKTADDHYFLSPETLKDLYKERGR